MNLREMTTEQITSLTNDVAEFVRSKGVDISAGAPTFFLLGFAEIIHYACPVTHNQMCDSLDRFVRILKKEDARRIKDRAGNTKPEEPTEGDRMMEFFKG